MNVIVVENKDEIIHSVVWQDKHSSRVLGFYLRSYELFGSQFVAPSLVEVFPDHVTGYCTKEEYLQ